MLSLYEKIEKLCSLNKINITEMCKLSGTSRGSLTDLKRGRIKTLSSESISKIADYFHVSTDYLLGNTDIKNKPTVKEDDELIAKIESNPLLKELYQKLAQMNDEQLEAFSKIIGLPKSDPQDK